MIQAIDPIKLKAAAEHLEWVLQQYPDELEVQSLLDALQALISDAKAGRIAEPIDGMSVPGIHDFGSGLFVPYKDPSVGAAYAEFVTELEGGLSDEEERLREDTQAMLSAIRGAKP